MKLTILFSLICSLTLGALYAQPGAKNAPVPINTVHLKKDANGKYVMEKPQSPEQPKQEEIPLLTVESTRAASTNGVDLKFDNEVFNFGKIKQGEVAKHSFKLTNTGMKDLILKDVKPSCGCTVPEWPKNAIKPGETAQIDVKFNSAGKLGKQKKTITVDTNSAPNNIWVLTLEGEVYNPVAEDTQKSIK